MAQSSILGGEHAPAQAAGRDTDALGPSDTSDSGSDVQGERAHFAGDADDAGSLPVELRSDSDASGTGERGSAVGDEPAEGADILPDQVVGGLTDDALDTDTLDIDDLDVDAEILGDIAIDETDEETDDAAAQ